MKIKLSREKIRLCYVSFCELLKKEGHSYKFNYAIIKNKNILQKLVKTISLKIAKMEKQRISICEKYCKKDEKNNPILTKNNNYIILEQEKFNKEIEVLTRLKDEFIEEEIEFDGYRINIEDIPVGIKGEHQECVMFFIEKNKIDREIKIN